MKIIYGAISEAGQREGENQDSVYCASDGNGGIFLVADGMGGHEDGRQASRTVREELQRCWEDRIQADEEKIHPYLMDASLKDALKKANKRIRSRRENGNLSGSTAVVLRIGSDGFHVLNCGDSRCYQVKKTAPMVRVRQLTRDDVWENIAENVRGLTSEEIKSHENRGRLMRAVGTETSFNCSATRGAVSGKMLFALCSDGVYRYLDGRCFERFLKEAYRRANTEEELMRRIDHIRDTVVENGAPDNFSLILIRVDLNS